MIRRVKMTRATVDSFRSDGRCNNRSTLGVGGVEESCALSNQWNRDDAEASLERLARRETHEISERLRDTGGTPRRLAGAVEPERIDPTPPPDNGTRPPPDQPDAPGSRHGPAVGSCPFVPAHVLLLCRMVAPSRGRARPTIAMMLTRLLRSAAEILLYSYSRSMRVRSSFFLLKCVAVAPRCLYVW